MSTRKSAHSKLTKTAIDRLSYDPDGPSQQILWDSSLSGFGCRVYPSGRKSFVIGYRFKGRWRMMALGAYGVLTVDQARRRAKSELGRAAGKTDPLEKRQRERRAKTVRQLVDAYIEDCRTRANPKKTWRVDKRRLERFLLPKYGGRKIDSVDMTDVESIHAAISKKTPYEANRVLALLSRVFNFARQKKLYPAQLPNPAQGVRKNREVSRREYVPTEKLPDLTAAIDAEQNPYTRAAFWLLLLTGMRRSELLNCTRSQVNLKERRIFLPDTKSGIPRYVLLNNAAVDIIRALPRMVGNEYLLPGQIAGKPLNNIDKAWRRIRERAELPRLRIHDLRRTAGSLMIQSGRSIDEVKEILGHQNRRTTEIYARLADQQLRAASDGYGDAIIKAAKGSESG